MKLKIGARMLWVKNIRNSCSNALTRIYMIKSLKGLSEAFQITKSHTILTLPKAV